MKHILKLYYHLTAYMPRPLPRDLAEFQQIKDILKNYYNVPDDPKSWRTMCGHMGSTPSNRIRKSYGVLANAAKRLNINALIHQQELLSVEELRASLEKAILKHTEDAKGTSDVQTLHSQ